MLVVAVTRLLELRLCQKRKKETKPYSLPESSLYFTHAGSTCGLPKMQDKAVGEPIGIPSLPVIQIGIGVQIRPATSGSSREQSDDDDIEGETEITENMDPADVKRARR